MLDNLRDKLAGKKTYIVAGGAIVAAFVGWVNGAMDTQSFIKSLVESILAMTIRAGVAKSSPQ